MTWILFKLPGKIMYVEVGGKVEGVGNSYDLDLIQTPWQDLVCRSRRYNRRGWQVL